MSTSGTALAVDNINQRLERAERFQLDTTVRLAAIDNSLAWITKIGAFMGSALLAVIFFLFTLSKQSGHLEEAVSTLQGDTKKVQEAVSTLQGTVSVLQADSKRHEAQLTKALAILESIDKRTASLSSPGQERKVE